MRPPEFTGGNAPQADRAADLVWLASMRPPEFTGGNCKARQALPSRTAPCFNEAAGIHRRKPRNRGVDVQEGTLASMRPPEFTGGNLSTVATSLGVISFNEAAGIHRRKHESRRARLTTTA